MTYNELLDQVAKELFVKELRLNGFVSQSSSRQSIEYLARECFEVAVIYMNTRDEYVKEVQPEVNRSFIGGSVGVAQTG